MSWLTNWAIQHLTEKGYRIDVPVQESGGGYSWSHAVTKSNQD